MNELDMSKAIQYLKPTAQFSFEGTDYSSIKWDVLDGDAPTEKEIEAAIKEVKAAELKKIADEQAKKELAQSKLAALGLDPDDLKVLGLG